MSGTFLFLSVVVSPSLNCSVTILTWGVSVEPLSSKITSSFSDSADGTLTRIVVVPCSDAWLSVSLKLVGGVGTGAKRRYWNYFTIERYLYRYNCYLTGNIKYWLLSLHIKKKQNKKKWKNNRIGKRETTLKSISGNALVCSTHDV